jgi:hypothetical protein
MSQGMTPRSDLFQTVKAVLIMSLFALASILIVLAKDNIMSFVCSNDNLVGMCSNQPSSHPPVISDRLVASRIDLACVDADGLKVSVAFEEPVTGEASVQIFSTGPDFFPSEHGMTDTYEEHISITNAADSLDLDVPVVSMDVGEQIFGNVVISREGGISSHIAYFLGVSDCAITSAPLTGSTSITDLDGAVVNFSASCLPSDRLMIAFEFDRPVPGQYQVLVADTPYRLASVVSQPAGLFFSGEAPPEGPVVVKLISATEQVVVFEESFTPPVCVSE